MADTRALIRQALQECRDATDPDAPPDFEVWADRIDNRLFGTPAAGPRPPGPTLADDAAACRRGASAAAWEPWTIAGRERVAALLRLAEGLDRLAELEEEREHLQQSTAQAISDRLRAQARLQELEEEVRRLAERADLSVSAEHWPIIAALLPAIGPEGTHHEE